MSARPSVGVIGAGIAGLAAARDLTDAGHEVVVFDKGRGPGGRCSTRRAGELSFDHGAQYFTAREQELRRCVVEWVERGVAAPWDGRIVALGPDGPEPVNDSTSRFVGVPGMSAVAKELAAGVDVRCGVRVTEVQRLESGWRLSGERGLLGEFERLIVTTPPAQAAALLGDHPLAARADTLVMTPCWAAMLAFREPSSIDFDGAFCSIGPFSWIARNSSKPGRGPTETWVLHARSDWSSTHFELSREEVARELATRFAALFSQPLPAVIHLDAHRWAFAQCDDGMPLGPLGSDDGLILAGDAYGGGRVGGAFANGRAAARLSRDV